MRSIYTVRGAGIAPALNPLGAIAIFDVGIGVVSRSEGIMPFETVNFWQPPDRGIEALSYKRIIAGQPAFVKFPISCD